MAKRVNVTLDFLAYESTVPTNDPSDMIRLLKRLEEDPVSEISRLQMSIDVSSSAESVPFQGTEADYTVIYADQAITIALNDSDTAVPLNPTVAGTKTPVLYLRGTVNKIVITNVAAAPANVDIVMVAL